MNFAFRRRVMAQGGGGIPLSSLPQGTLVSLNESGAPKLFLVAGHNYESSGRTILLRKWLHGETRAWQSAGKNTYANSTIDTWLNGAYLSMFDASVQGKIADVSIPYTIGAGHTTATTLSRKVFLLSGTEAGFSSSSQMNVEGANLGLFADDSSRIGYMEVAQTTAVKWGLRSPHTTNSSLTRCVHTNGSNGSSAITYSIGVRPAFTLPADLKMNQTPLPDGSYIPL